MFRGAAMFAASLCVGAGAGATYGAAAGLPQATAAAAAPASASSPFSPSEFRPFKLVSARYESHDTRRFYFGFEDPEATMGLPVASCIVLKYTDADGKDVTRPYTPISTADTKGRFELLVKKYPKSKMGTHLFGLKPGDAVEVKGPFEKFKYVPNQWKHVGMLAGGTGIAPMYQVVRAILDNPKDTTRVSLVYANNARRDILLANELTALQQAHTNFNLYLTLLEVPKRWLGGIGYINADIIKAFMPAPGAPKTKILVCGPPPMMKAISGDKEFPPGKAPVQGALSGLLKDLGYTEEQVFKY